MRKNLTVIGNSLGLILDKPLLDILNISKDTALDIKTDGQRLVIEPISNDDRSERIRMLTRKVIKSHEKTFRKLAE